MIKNTGGPAFPVIKQDLIESSTGMTLLDYFAGKALAGILARVPVNGYESHKDYSWAAREAYVAAEAMLIERKNRE